MLARLRLDSLERKILFAALCSLVLAAYVLLASTSYVAYHLASSGEPRSLEKAVRLRPFNADYRWQLGRYKFYVLGDAAAAVTDYEKAVALNRFDSHYYLDYANALVNLNRDAETINAVQRAILLDPTTPRTNWEAGNLYLVAGDTEAALHRFRVILEQEGETPEYPVLPLCWRVTRDPDLIIREALPPRAGAYLRFLQLLMKENNSQPAATTWQALTRLQQSFEPKLAFPYFNYLIAHKDVAGASQVWSYLTSSALSGYARSDNLIVNGDFEKPLLNGGFDWRYRESNAVSLTMDNDRFQSGRESLNISMHGVAADLGVAQLVPVDPATAYDFGAYVKAENIQGANGPQFQVQDAYSDQSLLLTDDLNGTFNWREVSGEFHTGPDTRLVLLRMVRLPGNTHVRGRLWIDDVSIRRK